MTGSRHRTVGLLGFAGVLSVIFIFTTLGPGFSQPEFGYILVGIVIGGAIVAAGLNGFWKGSIQVSVASTTLVAGGHLYASIRPSEARTVHASGVPLALFWSRFFGGG